MARGRRPKKEVEEAIRYAESRNWRVHVPPKTGHVWATLYCPLATRDGCKVFVLSTPQNPGNHANRIRAVVDRCPHTA